MNFTTETALRELTPEQADAEAAKFFPLDEIEKDAVRRRAALNLCRNMDRCVASFILGESSKRDLRRWLNDEIAKLTRWDQQEKWRAAACATFDNHRHAYIAHRRLIRSK
jgi:hypothetical protein